MKSVQPASVTRTELHQFFSEIGKRAELGASRSSVGLRLVEDGQRELAHFLAAIRLRLTEDGKTCSSRGRAGLQAHPGLRQFLSGFRQRLARAEAQKRHQDEHEATGFNVFDLIEPDENKLSDILAILLDPRGAHGQGDLFLRLLLKQLDVQPDPPAIQQATVRREAATHTIRNCRRRMDILVDAGVLLAVENKLDSAEQTDQLKDYLDHLRRCMPSHDKHSGLIYLTPDGRSPESLTPDALAQAEDSGRLHCWSYQQELCVWLEACRRGCQAPKICAFLGDFIAHIQSALKRETENNQEEEGNET